MNKKITALVAGGLAALTAVCAFSPSFLSFSEFNENGTYAINPGDKAALIGVDNPDDYFLGVASQFSVFLNGDFTALGSDCEGRLAAAGSANLGDETPSYSVGAKLADGNENVAHVVIGGQVLKNFQPNQMNFVAPLDADVQQIFLDYMENGDCKVYEGELFSFEDEFKKLNERSFYLKNLEENATLETNPYYDQEWIITGTDPNLNVINLDSSSGFDEFAVFNNGYLDMNIRIPEGSYLVINVPGDNIFMPQTNVKVVYTDKPDMEPLQGENLPLLYNLPDASVFKYTGSIQGSTLAPNADASGDEGGHVAGMTVAKSFEGGIQFGYSNFNPKMLSIVEATTTAPTTTTTTTTATTTTTTATTTTTTTTTATTSTTTATTSTTTATTSTATTPTTTTATSTTDTTTAATTTTTATTTDTTSTTTDTTTAAPVTTNEITETTETSTSTPTTTATTTTTTATTTTATTTATTTTTTTATTTTTSTTTTTTTTTATTTTRKVIQLPADEEITTTTVTTTATTTTTAATTTGNKVDSPKTGDNGLLSVFAVLGSASVLCFLTARKLNKAK